MGEANVIVNQWLGTKKRVADLFNGYVFRGRQIVDPAKLEPLDREADIIVTGKDEKKGRQHIGILLCAGGMSGWRFLHVSLRIRYIMPCRSE